MAANFGAQTANFSAQTANFAESLFQTFFWRPIQELIPLASVGRKLGTRLRSFEGSAKTVGDETVLIESA